MTTEQTPALPRPVRKVSALAIILLIVGLAAGFGGGYIVTQPTINDLTARANRLQTDLTTVQETNKRLDAELTSTRADLTATQASLTATEQRLTGVEADLQQNRDQLQTTLKDFGSAKEELGALRTRLETITKAVQLLSADRLVFIELRRDRTQLEFPNPSDPAAIATARQDLHTLWGNVKTLATQADSSLVPAIDRVVARIDAWLDWVQRFPVNGTLEDLGRWYNDGGVGGYFDYFTAVDDFESQFNLVAITHVDRVAGLLG